MTFDESKISAEKAAETGVQSQPDALTGSAEENKKVFDLLPLLIIERLNKLIEALQAANSARTDRRDRVYQCDRRHGAGAAAEHSKEPRGLPQRGCGEPARKTSV